MPTLLCMTGPFSHSIPTPPAGCSGEVPWMGVVAFFVCLGSQELVAAEQRAGLPLSCC